MLEKIKTDLPNFPEEVIKDWLEHHGGELEWPPTSERWIGILGSKSLEFWRKVKWEKRVLDLTSLNYHPDTIHINEQTKQAYIMKQENAYSQIKNGEDRNIRSFYFLIKNGTFPKPICLLEEDGVYSVVDGHHRMLAFTTYQTVMHVYKNAQTEEHKAGVASFRETLNRKWDIDEPKDFSPTQEVWVASIV